METKEIINYRGVDIHIYYDEDPQSPNEWGDEERFIVYDHRQFCVKRKYFDPTDIYEHTSETKRMFYDGFFVFPLYAYIHSGVSLSLSRGYDRWDTSLNGFVLIKREKGCYTKDAAYKAAEAIVDEWNEYLSGEVYGYDSSCGSCWGFYGKSGLEQLIDEAKSEIDYKLAKNVKKYFDRKKVEIKNRVPYEKRLIYELL